MSELDDWASEVHYQPGGKGSSVDEWLDQHPDRIEQVIEARSRGWSWRRITDFLTAKADFPYATNAVINASRRRGIQ